MGRKWHRTLSGIWTRRRPPVDPLLPALRLPRAREMGGPYPCPECCPSLPCLRCTGDTPGAVQVSVPALFGVNCGNCPAYAGDYGMTQINPCRWRYVYPEPPCDLDTIDVVWQRSGSAPSNYQYLITVNLYQTGNIGNFVRWGPAAVGPVPIFPCIGDPVEVPFLFSWAVQCSLTWRPDDDQAVTVTTSA